MRPWLSATVIASALTPGCSTTTGRAAADALSEEVLSDATLGEASLPDGVLPDGALPSGPCRWRVGEAVVLPRSMAHRTLIDVEPSRGGAWVLSSDDEGINRQPDLTLERLEASGRRLAGSPTELPVSFASGRASLAIHDGLNRRAVLEESPAGSALPGCWLLPLDPAGVFAARAMISLPFGGFSLGGCKDLLVNTLGYTFLSEQIRALWGVSMVQLNPAGVTVIQQPPGLLEEFPDVPFERFGTSDRSFVMAWTSRERTGTSWALRVHRFDEAGRAQGEAQSVAEGTNTRVGAFTVLETSSGLMALWEESLGTSQPYHVTLRSLRADGSPAAVPRVLSAIGFYQGGLCATFTRGEVLTAAITGSGVLRPTVTVLTPEGTPRGDALPIPIPLPPGSSRVENLRIVSTISGALAVFTTDPGAYPNNMVAVPLYCDSP